MKKLLLVSLLLSSAVFVQAQGADFLIYSFKGNVSVVENNAEAKAKVGKLMNSSATIKVANGSAVTLICNEAAMFTITKGGTYPLRNFGDSCKVSKSSVSSNYVKYVWAQMTKSSGSPGSNRKAYMNTVGAVSRSINNVWIDPRLDTVNYCDGDVPLSWKSYADAEEFEFFLFSSTDIVNPIYKTTVKKHKVPVSDLLGKIKPGNTYYWTAAVKGEENDDLKVLNYKKKEDFKSILETIKAQGVPFEGEAEQAYRIAFMLEDAHFLAEAHDYYEKAATADEANVLYRSTLMSFRKDYEIK
ncbi:MAG: hypothetical protein KDB99_06555 [Chitinophagaceae bacterium]|nr:hypothetical protein [Chitinophagaceae bacterium]